MFRMVLLAMYKQCWRIYCTNFSLGTSFGQRLIIRVLLQYMRGKQIEIKARPVIRIVE